MGISFRANVRVRTARAAPGDPADPGIVGASAIGNSDAQIEAVDAAPPGPGALALLGGFALVAGMVLLLWAHLGFARYACTGIFWTQTQGTVISARPSSAPTVQFRKSDGAVRTFSEDYLLLCGSRSLCMSRNFTPGQFVPVVYDPAAPQYAYVHDWALTSNALLWFIELAAALLFALLLAIALRRKPLQLSVQLGGRSSQSC